MADLPMKDIRAISLDAVRRIAGSQAGDAEVGIGLDSSDEPVYDITLQLDRDQQSVLSSGGSGACPPRPERTAGRDRVAA